MANRTDERHHPAVAEHRRDDGDVEQVPRADPGIVRDQDVAAGLQALRRVVLQELVDFARIDMEHSALSIETVADMAVLARALDFPIVVRPPKANREWITRLSDVGVWNIHCPQVETADQAAEIVAATRYAPIVLRGNGGLSPATDFETGGTASERRVYANEQVFVTVMLETGGAFEHLDRIAAMDGIDALTLEPADLAQDLGVFGTPEQERLLNERRELILAAAKKYGKTCSMLVSSPEQARQWKQAGALLLAHSTDAEILLIVGLEQEGTNEPGDGSLVGKDADNVAAPLDLAVQSFEWVGAVQLGAVLGGKPQVGQHVDFCFVHQGCQLRHARSG